MFNSILCRLYSSSSNSIGKVVYNRNPRNLEKLRIARKPQGYHLDRTGREYWHMLFFQTTKRHIIGQIIHNNGHVVVSASTNEWALKKHLYNTNDISAYHNLARVLAQRCLESGISEITCHYKAEPNTKLNEFLTVLKEEGVALSEPEVYVSQPLNRILPGTPTEKPWEALEKNS